MTSQNAPVAIGLGTVRRAKAISLGNEHTCAILDNNTLKCWGRNNYGQIGNGNDNDQNAPTLVNLGDTTYS